MHQIGKDTVEEFWGAEILDECYFNSTHICQSDFLSHLSCFLGSSGKMWAVESARYALQRFLKCAADHQRQYVLICNFNCRVVADAVVKAGFQVKTFDFLGSEGRIDWDDITKELSDNCAAVVIPHFFGVPTDFRPIIKKAQDMGVIIIEDCAHTLGGKIEGRTVGTLGDAAIFSFNYDKPISLGGGGVLLVNYIDIANKITISSVLPSAEKEYQELKKFLMFLRHRRSSIRQLFDSSLKHKSLEFMKRVIAKFPVPYRDVWLARGIGPLRSALGIWQLDNYHEIILKRNDNAHYLAQNIGSRSWYAGSKEITPAWLKQKIILKDKAQLNKVCRYLCHNGIRVGRFNWPVTMADCTETDNPTYSCNISNLGIDVPVHQNMSKVELDAVVKWCR